jgi:GAF domain-containing protein
VRGPLNPNQSLPPRPTSGALPASPEQVAWAGVLGHPKADGEPPAEVFADVDLATLLRHAKMRSLLERSVADHANSAAILRAHRRPAEAARAEQFAWRVRLLLDEPAATERMFALCRTVCESSHLRGLLECALEGAISLTGGDFGNVQLCDLARGTLRIATQSGFNSEFLEYFAAVDDDSSACGRAARQGSQTVIVDVKEDPAFAPHREIAAGSGFRAVQSTPLIDPLGRLRGVISTHFRLPHRPSSRELHIIEWYGENVGAALADLQLTPTRLYDTTEALHRQTADRHAVTASLFSQHAQALVADGREARAAENRECAARAEHRALRARARADAVADRARNGREAGDTSNSVSNMSAISQA